MEDLNVCYLMGCLTADPVSRQAGQSGTLCEFSIALNRKTKQGAQKTSFVQVTVWGRNGELCAENLSKGCRVHVTGRLDMDSWKDKATGQDRTKLVCTAVDVKFIEGFRNKVNQQNGDVQHAPSVAQQQAMYSQNQSYNVPQQQWNNAQQQQWNSVPQQQQYNNVHPQHGQQSPGHGSWGQNQQGGGQQWQG